MTGTDRRREYAPRRRLFVIHAATVPSTTSGIIRFDRRLLFICRSFVSAEENHFRCLVVAVVERRRLRTTVEFLGDAIAHFVLDDFDHFPELGVSARRGQCECGRRCVRRRGRGQRRRRQWQQRTRLVVGRCIAAGTGSERPMFTGRSVLEDRMTSRTDQRRRRRWLGENRRLLVGVVVG